MGDTSSRQTVPKRRYSKAVFRFGHRGFTNWYISSPAGRAWVHERYRARTCDPFRAGFREDLACELEKDTPVFAMELRRGGSLSEQIELHGRNFARKGHYGWNRG